MSSEILNSYTPDEEEVNSALSFMLNCTGNDLASAWEKATEEWDVDSVIRIHRELCSSGRINLLISEMTKLIDKQT